MKLFTIAASLAALLAPAPAVAADLAQPNPRAQIKKLKKRVVAQRAQMAPLKKRVVAQGAQMAALKKRDVAHRAQIAALNQRVAELQARAAVTVTKPAPAAPSALTTAVEQIRREVVYSERTLQRTGVINIPREQLIAHAAMTFVVGHVSAPGYGYMNEIMGIRPIATAEGVLQAESGICGHAALTFAAIVKRLGLPVRSVQFYYGAADNHIANEVFYAGSWHYFDPTFGAYYRDGDHVLSIAEARAHPAPLSLLEHSETLLWYSVAETAGLTSLTDLGIETDPATRVEIDKQPFTA